MGARLLVMEIENKQITVCLGLRNAPLDREKRMKLTLYINVMLLN